MSYYGLEIFLSNIVENRVENVKKNDLKITKTGKPTGQGRVAHYELPLAQYELPLIYSKFMFAFHLCYNIDKRGLNKLIWPSLPCEGLFFRALQVLGAALLFFRVFY